MSVLPTNALVTRKQVKDYMDITGADSVMDNLINDLIGRVSQAFENYCGRAFVSATYTEYYDGGESFLFLDNYPVTSITSINDDPAWEWGASTLVDSDYYRIQDERSVVFNGTFSKGNQGVKIVYVAGYSTIPTDLQHACIEEVARKTKHRKDFDEGSKTLDDGSVTFFDLAFLPQTMKTLSFYKIKAVY